MAQVYSNKNQTKQDAFNSHQFFAETSSVKEASYNEVLNMFRNIFKKINYHDLFM